MEIINGKIISCTEEELYDYWLKRYSEIIGFDEYLRKVQQNGTIVKTKNEYKVVKNNKFDGLKTKTLKNGFIEKNKWIKVSTPKSTKFQCPVCKKIVFCLKYAKGNKKETYCDYRFCPYCAAEIQL